MTYVKRINKLRGQSEEVVSVIDYGAKGDGVTDDTTALNNALSAASPVGGKVLVQGTIGVNSTISVPSGVTLDCTQGKIKALAGFTSETPVLKFGDSATNSRWIGYSPKIRVDCGGQRIIGVEFSKPWQRAEFYDVEVYNFKYKGIVVTSGYGLQLYSYNIHAVNLTGEDYQFNADTDSIGLEVLTTDCYFGPGDIFGTFIGVKASAGHNKFDGVHPFGIFQKAGVPQSTPMGICFYNTGQNNVFIGCIADSPAMIDYAAAASLSNGGYGFYDGSSGYQSRFVACTTYVPDRSGVGEAAPVNKMIGFYCGNAAGYYGCQIEDNVGSILTKFDGSEKERCFISSQDESNMVYYQASYASVNWQRFRQYWNGSTYTMQGEFGGSATGNDVLIGSASSTILMRYNQSSSGSYELSRVLTNASAVHTRLAGTFSQSSGMVTALYVAPNINQSSTAGYTALLINPTESATGSGAKNLIDAQVGGASKFKVDNTGSTTMSGIAKAVSTKTADYTATASDHTILGDATSGNIVITLPAAANHVGRMYIIKKIDSSANTVTIDGNASETIDGATTKVLDNQWDSMTIQCNGTAWYIIDQVLHSSTAVSSATFVQNSGNAINDASTFDGYTVPQAIKALRENGDLT